MGAVIREGETKERLWPLGLTKKMLPAKLKMSNIFLHFSQNIDLPQ
jgi:hypothetical protein